MALSITKPILFGSFTVTSSVFHLTAHSFAFVNLKPILPGHVLVSPLRVVPRLADLSPAEASDLFLTVQRVGRMVERTFAATALNISVQDGVTAGQSVPHVHAHVIPRREGDFAQTDDVYKELEGERGDVGAQWRERERARGGGKGGMRVDADEDRRPRTEEEMAKEAKWLAEEMEKLPA